MIFDKTQEEIEFLKVWYNKSYEQTRTIEEYSQKQIGFRFENTKKFPDLELKCKEYEKLLVKMEESH